MRFAYVQSLGMTRKVQGLVAYEESFDLTPWMSGGSSAAYHLAAVISHHGQSLTAGHYTSRIRSSSGGWVEANGTSLYATNDSLDPDAYCLFYMLDTDEPQSWATFQPVTSDKVTPDYDKNQQLDGDSFAALPDTEFASWELIQTSFRRLREVIQDEGWADYNWIDGPEPGEVFGVLVDRLMMINGQHPEAYEVDFELFTPELFTRELFRRSWFALSQAFALTAMEMRLHSLSRRRSMNQLLGTRSSVELGLMLTAMIPVRILGVVVAVHRRDLSSVMTAVIDRLPPAFHIQRFAFNVGVHGEDGAGVYFRRDPVMQTSCDDSDGGDSEGESEDELDIVVDEDDNLWSTKKMACLL
ncbi:hypothetical protein BKA62DRAFT_793906 [Auriculariales sp. MPI-PUGE-AT-0066]|nr:hypothetical protein BKA62DRAFT_793906 [Auriculariales sp. MPI-PUGE-AT-0066]